MCVASLVPGPLPVFQCYTQKNIETVACMGMMPMCGYNLLFCIITDKDYSILSESPLILSTEFPNDTITINIKDDNLFELAESFEIFLLFKDQAMIPRVTLDPRTANITIRCMKFKILTYYMYS